MGQDQKELKAVTPDQWAPEKKVAEGLLHSTPGKVYETGGKVMLGQEELMVDSLVDQ